jgi:F-type H+-transporting ATPase subunit b
MVSIDGSLFIQIANFLFLIFVLNMVLYKPIRKVLIQRREKVSGLEKSIETADQEAEEQNQAYASGLKDARAKGKEEKDALLEAAAEEERAIVNKINEKAQADLADVRAKIATDAESVKASLMKEIDTFAKAIGEKILGRAV